MTDIVQRALAYPPVDTRLIAGRWHPNRATLRGVWVEALVWGSSMLRPVNHDIKKFIIIARARSGSTLLTRLLNANPHVRCGGELLSQKVLAPEWFLRNLARKAPTDAYGAKLLSFQMIQVQRMRDPVGFLRNLEDQGFRFIHLERNTFAQTLSLFVAQSSKLFHQKDKTDTAPAAPMAAPHMVSLDVEDFMRRLEWSALLLDYERHCLSPFEHLHISYEDYLETGEHQQAAADRVFDWIGVPSAPVSGRMRKVLPSDPRKVIRNYDALTDAMRARGFGALVPEG